MSNAVWVNTTDVHCLMHEQHEKLLKVCSTIIQYFTYANNKASLKGIFFSADAKA